MRHVITEIGTLVTMQPLVRERRWSRIQGRDLGALRTAWLALDQGQVVAFGTGSLPEAYHSWPNLSAKGGLVLPGLVDCHTHPCYGGTRSQEFAQRLAGATYQQIAAAGGGIKSTVHATREWSEEELANRTLAHLRRFLRHGVTTVEAKSGYGLSVEHELKMLRAIRKASAETPQTVVPTCLALHAMPPEFTDKKAYAHAVTENLLPQVAREGLAMAVDAFVEKGYFEPADCEAYIRKARELGLAVRIHADEFADSGAAAAAVQWQALSADHLECANQNAIEAMAQQQVVGVLLPGTSLYTKIPYTRAEPFRTAGCPMALATDFNPGSCRIENLPFVATLGALHCGMTAAEALAAVTIVPAYSLRLHHRKGALVPGFDADVVIYRDLDTVEEWIADMGQHQPDIVFVRGEAIS